MVAEVFNPSGALAGALAKAQAAFPPIPRDKEVEVKTKTGGTYTFKYAPLDTIIAAVRGPLSENGLAFSQLLDGGDLVTVLLHSSGETLTGRTPLPHSNGDTVQQYGSAVTYVRRYALQAVLGIAAEEDDDGNAASGNSAKARTRGRQQETAEPQPPPRHGSLIGIAGAGNWPADFELRQTPPEEGAGWRLAFRLEDGAAKFKAITTGALAEWMAANRAAIEGQRVTCYGAIGSEPWTPKGTKKVVDIPVINVERIETPAGAFPAAASEMRDEIGRPAPAPGDDDLRDLTGGGR